MILLLAFAFLAGFVTILSPCILPVLPIILSSTIADGKRSLSRPIGVVTGFVMGFTFFTLALSGIVRTIGIPADTLRIVSIIAIAAFGLSLVIPQIRIFTERMLSSLTGRMPGSNPRSGFGGGIIIGLSVGLLWTPCVGPILASVITLALSGTVTFDAAVITLSYALGTAIPMFLVIAGGQQALHRLPGLTRNLGTIQRVFGLVMILTAVMIALNLDRKFQTFILESFPSYGTGLTVIEDNPLVRHELDRRNGVVPDAPDMGKPMFTLTDPKGKPAPELIPGGEWFNSDQLTLADLRGKVVIIDFWTYSCINCQRTLPYLRTWYEKYRDQGLVIIGVHAPEFEFEKKSENVVDAIRDFGITYPVMQDNDFATWRAYKNRYWPAKYFIDAEGNIRYEHFGEGAYDESERVIRELLAEIGSDVTGSVDNPEYRLHARTPETYLGYARIDGFASPERISEDNPAAYTLPTTLPVNSFAFGGTWTVTLEYALPAAGSSLRLNFEAKDVYLVMRSTTDVSRVSVLVDGAVGYPGKDTEAGIVTVSSDTLYHITHLPESGRHTLELEFPDGNTELYAFTFG